MWPSLQGTGGWAANWNIAIRGTRRKAGPLPSHDSLVITGHMAPPNLSGPGSATLPCA